MLLKSHVLLVIPGILLAVACSGATAQTLGQPERFTAIAIQNNEYGAAQGTVEITIDRWSTPGEREHLVSTLQQKGPDALLRVMQGERPVGRIRTPDSLGYVLRYAQMTPLEDGGRSIVIATDRPIGFWEATVRPRTIDYPFTVIQMKINDDGTGSGTLSVATRITARGNTIELENFASQPAMLTNIRTEAKR